MNGMDMEGADAQINMLYMDDNGNLSSPFQNALTKSPKSPKNKVPVQMKQPLSKYPPVHEQIGAFSYYKLDQSFL